MKRISELATRRVSAGASWVLMLLCFVCLRVGAAPVPGPCASNQEVRQLDFWLGDWNIGDGENPGTATSKVSLELESCLIVEHWDDPAGNQGMNLFGYNLDDKAWGGMFADTRGQVHIFVRGTVGDGRAEFYGPSRGPRGATVLNRITLLRLSANKVEQTWEKSADNGATWKTVFRGEYSRANPR